MVRNPDTCQEFLRLAMRRAGWVSPDMAEEAEQRLEKGAEEYGEDQFMHATCKPYAEAMEEAVDGAGGWCVLEHQKNILLDRLGPEDEFLLEAAADFVRAYRNLSLYRHHKYGH